jgi:redox-sensitive bicupin YhaK (pirin superfamily)
MSAIHVERLINGVMIREGAGVKLHRYIGIERTDDFEPLLLLDYFDSSNPIDFMAGFPSHPHRGFETITYLLEGTIVHEDNKGNKGVIGAGDVQWMTAGKGIVHSEMPFSESGRLKGLQLWLNLPAAKKMCAPRYRGLLSTQLPIEKNEFGAVTKVIAGKTDKGTKSPISNIATKPLFFDIHLPLGSSLKQHIPQGYETVLLVILGAVFVDGDLIKEGILAKFSAGNVLTLVAEKNSQCVLIAAKKLHEPIVRHGPFVMNTVTEVMEALDDFRSGKF